MGSLRGVRPDQLPDGTRSAGVLACGRRASRPAVIRPQWRCMPDGERGRLAATGGTPSPTIGRFHMPLILGVELRMKLLDEFLSCAATTATGR
jgi:hypothetical protein